LVASIYVGRYLFFILALRRTPDPLVSPSLGRCAPIFVTPKSLSFFSSCLSRSSISLMTSFLIPSFWCHGQFFLGELCFLFRFGTSSWRNVSFCFPFCLTWLQRTKDLVPFFLAPPPQRPIKLYHAILPLSSGALFLQMLNYPTLALA